MPLSFNTIGVLGRVRHERVKEAVISLITHLKAWQKTILVETITAEPLTDLELDVFSLQELSAKCDLLIVVGGDGSLLHAAHGIVKKEIPVLGINRGNLGFLTDIHPKELHKIKTILDGDYILEKRFLLSSTVQLNGTLIGKDHALNEVAILPDAIPHMIEIEIYINDQFMCSQNSDGLIIATPTGSTAYALSGGGPILHPQLDAIVLVPMFSHTLSSRPIVVEANQNIRIVISHDNITTPRVSCDGRETIGAPAGSIISIQKKTEQLHLIHALDYNYYEALRSKLHWGKKLQYVD